MPSFCASLCAMLVMVVVVWGGQLCRSCAGGESLLRLPAGEIAGQFQVGSLRVKLLVSLRLKMLVPAAEIAGQNNGFGLVLWLICVEIRKIYESSSE